MGNHLQDLLVGVSGIPDFLEYLVRRVTAGLIHFPGEPQEGGPVGIFGLETLYPTALVAIEADLLRNCGVDRQSISTAMLVGDRHRDRFLILVTEGSLGESTREIQITLEGRWGDRHLAVEVDDLPSGCLLGLFDQGFGLFWGVLGLYSVRAGQSTTPIVSYVCSYHTRSQPSRTGTFGAKEMTLDAMVFALYRNRALTMFY